MSDAELKRALRERAYLEGDFVLRSGKRSRFYLDKYRFSTQPDLLEAIAARIAAAVSEAEPDAVRLAAPELGAVPLAAGASLASRLPYLIVRGQAKEYGTANRIEGHFAPGEKVCLVEDVVTTGGAAVEAIQRAAGVRARVQDGRLRRRPRGGRGGRAGPCRRSFTHDLPRSRDSRGLNSPARPAWLSGSDGAVTLTRL